MSTVDDDGFDWANLEPASETEQPAETQEEPSEAATAEVEVEETAPERPRNPDGTFAKKAEPEDPEVQAILAKYGGDQAKALKALAESQSYIGSLHNELGELRQTVAQAQQEWQRPRLQTDFDALLEENPQQAAMMALQAGDHAAYSRAKQEWNDISPGAPDLFEQNLRTQAELREIREALAQTQAPLVEQGRRQHLARAYQEVAQANPDFEDLRPQMAEVVTELESVGYDWITPALESGDQAQARGALHALVKMARAHRTGNLAQAAQEAARQHVAETEAAKRDAIVASATSTVATTEDKSPADALWDQWAQFDRGRLRDS